MLDTLYFCVWLSVQIILESLPISSSGHLALVEYWFPNMGPQVCLVGDFAQENVHKAYETLVHFLHGPTLFVLAVVFFSSWFFLVRSCIRYARLIGKLIFFAFIADCVTALFFLAFAYSGVAWFPLPLGFVVTAGALASLYARPAVGMRVHYLGAAFLLGAVQGLALLPGISRLASTFVAARWLGYSDKRALLVSCMIQVPLILAAFARSVYHLHSYNMWHCFASWPVVITILLATVLATSALWLVKKTAYEHRLWLFAWYMLIPIIVAVLT